MPIYVICHQELPCFPLPAEAEIIWLNATPPVNPDGRKIHYGYDLIPEGQTLHQKLSGGFGPMVINHLLQTTTQSDECVTLWQYRKFVTRERYGRPSNVYGGTHELSVAEAASLVLSADPEPGQSLLFSSLLQVGSIYQQYVECHHIADLLRYTALAVDLGVLTAAESHTFLQCPWLVIGGIELGTYPLSWWQETFSALEKVATAFIAQHQPVNLTDPYQKRALAFCQERLGSFLLLRDVTATCNNNIPKNLFGTVHSVTSSGVYQRGV